MLKHSIKTLSLSAALALAATGAYAQTTNNSTVNTNQTPAAIGVSPQTANDANQRAIQRSDTGTVVRTDGTAAEQARDVTNQAQNTTGTNNTGTSGSSGTSGTGSAGTSGSTGATGDARTTGNSTTSNTNAASGGTTGSGTTGTGGSTMGNNTNTDSTSMDTPAQRRAANRTGARAARADRN